MRRKPGCIRATVAREQPERLPWRIGAQHDSGRGGDDSECDVLPRGRHVGKRVGGDEQARARAHSRRRRQIVQAQIGDGGPAATARSPTRKRSITRAEATCGRLQAEILAAVGATVAQSISAGQVKTYRASFRRRCATCFRVRPHRRLPDSGGSRKQSHRGSPRRHGLGTDGGSSVLPFDIALQLGTRHDTVAVDIDIVKARAEVKIAV